MSHLDHCGVYVKDLEKSLSFYQDLFSWKEKTRWTSGNWTHLAIHIPDWAAKVKKLETAGTELRKVQMNGANIAFFKDPDGHTLEIMERSQGI